MRRRRLGRRRSRKMFSKNASRTHKYNMNAIMRGGFRI